MEAGTGEMTDPGRRRCVDILVWSRGSLSAIFTSTCKFSVIREDCPWSSGMDESRGYRAEDRS